MMRPKRAISASVPKLFDVVELVSAPVGGTVQVGAIGTVVEELRDDVYLVEFCDEQGRAVAIEAVPASSLALHA